MVVHCVPSTLLRLPTTAVAQLLRIYHTDMVLLLARGCASVKKERKKGDARIYHTDTHVPLSFGTHQKSPGYQFRRCPFPAMVSRRRPSGTDCTRGGGLCWTARPSLVARSPERRRLAERGRPEGSAEREGGRRPVRLRPKSSRVEGCENYPAAR